MEIGTVEIGSLTLESGIVLDQVHLAYEWARKDHAPTILVCHALTGNQHTIGNVTQSGWWSGLIGAGKSVDTDQYAVITFNVLGGCNGSTGPTSKNPHTNTAYKSSFPEITIRDMVNAERKALLALGIERLHTVIGGSLGGMRVLEWGIMYPDDMDLLIPLAVTPSLGEYEVASYLNHVSRKISSHFESNSYCVLLRALNTHDIGRGRGGVTEAAKKIKAKTVLLGFTLDLLYPPEKIHAFADLLPDASFCLVNTKFGHDGFLTEFEKWGFLIQQFLFLASENPNLKECVEYMPMNKRELKIG